MAGHDLEVLGVGVVVRIAERVDVPLRPADRAGRLLEHRDAIRGIHEALRALLDVGIAAARQHQRQPAGIELQARRHEDVGVLDRFHQAGLRRDEVRVGVPRAQALRRDVLPADEPGDRSEVAQGRGDFQISERGHARQEAEDRYPEASNQRLHAILPKFVVQVLARSMMRRFSTREPGGIRSCS